MTQYVWIGGSSTAASTAGNWYSIEDAATATSVPAAGDDVLFDYRGKQNCVWDITGITNMRWATTESERFLHDVQLTADVSISGLLILNGDLTQSGTRTVTFTGASAENGKFISNGKRANPTDTINYRFATGGQKVRFDTGPHPTVIFDGSQFVPQHTPRTTEDNSDGTKRKSTIFHKLTLTSGILAPLTVDSMDRQCEYLIKDTTSSAFTCALTSINFGQATFGLPGGTAGSPRALPVSGSSSYGAGGVFSFNAYGLRAYYPDKSTIGSGVSSFLMGAGLKLSVQKLVIDEGCAIFGEVTSDIHPEIETCNAPLIRGSFGNFVKVSNHVYRAMKDNVLYSSILGYRHGGTGLKTLGTAGQVIKVNSGATALEWGTASASTDIDALSALGGTGLHQSQDHFMFSDNGTEKKITFSNLEDAIFANVSGDATIAAGGALTIATDAVELGMLQDITDERILGRVDNSDGSVAELTKANVLTMLNVSDGADVTNTSTVTAAGAVMDSEVTNLAFVKGLAGGISNGNVLVANAAVADDDFLRVDGTQIEGRTAAELKADLDLETADIVTASLGAALTVVTLATSVTGFASGAYTIAPMTNVVKDVTSGWDTSGYYFTVPSPGGIYQIEWSASIRYISTSHAAVTRLQKDSGSGFGLLANGTTCNDSGAISNGTWTGQLAAGDKIALYVYHNGGSGKNLIGDNVAANFTHMGIRMVGT